MVVVFPVIEQMVFDDAVGVCGGKVGQIAFGVEINVQGTRERRLKAPRTTQAGQASVFVQLVVVDRRDDDLVVFVLVENIADFIC